jgi:methionine-rich copper-binding protein CopC
MGALTGADARSTQGGMRSELVCLIFLLLFGGGLRDALAHARLVKSAPTDKAVLTEAPARVDLWFNELLDQGFHSLEVIPAAQLKAKERVNFANGKPIIDPKDRTRVSVALKPLSPGDYVIEWRMLSRDGHSAPGRLKFTVTAPTN